MLYKCRVSFIMKYYIVFKLEIILSTESEIQLHVLDDHVQPTTSGTLDRPIYTEPLKEHVGNSEILFRSLEIYFVPSKYYFVPSKYISFPRNIISFPRNIFRSFEIHFVLSKSASFPPNYTLPPVEIPIVSTSRLASKLAGTVLRNAEELKKKLSTFSLGGGGLAECRYH